MTGPVNDLPDLLGNYRLLVRKTDELCSSIVRDFSDEISCTEGCDSCCCHISIFRVEAISIAKAVVELSNREADFIRSRAQSASGSGACPLLFRGRCLLYPHRPIICRTHGLPILTGEGSPRTIDFCPRNFRRTETIPGSAVIDLDRLNDTLAAVNALFMRQYFRDGPHPEERLTMADALLLKV